MNPSLESSLNSTIEEFRVGLLRVCREYCQDVIRSIAFDGVTNFNEKNGANFNFDEGSRRGRGKGRGKGKRGSPRAAVAKKGKRDPEAMAAITTRLLAHITKNPGCRMTEIAPALNSTTKDLVRPVQKLLAEKKISKKGERVLTKYFPK